MSHKPLRLSCCMLPCTFWNKHGAIKQFQQRSRFYCAHCQHCNQPHPTPCFASWTKAKNGINVFKRAASSDFTNWHCFGGATKAIPKSFSKVKQECCNRKVWKIQPFRPYPNARRTVERPLTSETVSKDIVISLEFGREKIPTKSEKAELERSGRIIRGTQLLFFVKYLFGEANIA